MGGRHGWKVWCSLGVCELLSPEDVPKSKTNSLKLPKLFNIRKGWKLPNSFDPSKLFNRSNESNDPSPLDYLESSNYLE